MAVNTAPSAWIDDIAVDGTNLVIPLASLEGLSADEAHGTTGDIRKIARAVLHTLVTAYLALDAEDRPTKMVLTRTTTTDDGTGAFQRTYSAQFDLEASGEEVVDED